MITNHTQLLNALIEKYNLKSYLEIGVQNVYNNYDKIKCVIKYGVDPNVTVSDLNNSAHNGIHIMTSDEYFNEDYINIYDLIFIDGLHHADQVKRDFENSLRCLSDNGFIVIHDVLPENEAGTVVPRETKQWWGDVYKWAMNMNIYEVDFVTYNIDNGCMVIKKNKGKINYNGIVNADWKIYTEYGYKLMNVTDTVEI